MCLYIKCEVLYTYTRLLQTAESVLGFRYAVPYQKADNNTENVHKINSSDASYIRVCICTCIMIGHIPSM
jgi:hypothetical protein